MSISHKKPAVRPVPKTALVRSTARPSLRPAASRSPVVPRSARRRTQATLPVAGSTRSTARLQVLDDIAALGLPPLKKPALRRAIDRRVKLLTAVPPPSEPSILDEMAEIHPMINERTALPSASYLGVARHGNVTTASVPVSPRSAAPPVDRSAWTQVYDTLHDSVTRTEDLLIHLGVRLSPVLHSLPPNENGAAVDSGNVPTPMGVLGSVEHERFRVDLLNTRLAGLIERLVV